MKYRLPDGRLNPEWAHANYLSHRTEVLERSRKYAESHRERLRELKNRWNHIHKDRVQETTRKYTLELKKQAIQETNGEIRCAIDGCGCDELELLQANYKEGGHTRLAAKGVMRSGGVHLYRDIARGRVNPNLFNFLCPPHNSIDHLPEIRSKFRIQWIS